MDRYLVISSDGHAGPPADVYRDYLDPDFRERFDAHQQAASDQRRAIAAESGKGFKKEWEAETGGDSGLTAAYDSDARNAILDTEGVAAEVLFPDADVLGTGRVAASPFGTGLAVGSQSEPADAIAGSRAHNRWLADFCSQDPERRIGVAVIPAIIPDMDTVLRMVREAKDLGHLGILIPSRWFDRPAYHDLCYEPLWTLVEDLGLVLHTHSGAGPTDIGPGPGMLPIYVAEAGWWAGRPLAVLIWGGVFERHPNLMYSMAENACWWVPDQIRKMDEKWVGAHNTRKFGDVFRQELTMKPSDYLNRNCFFAASTPGEDDIERRHLVGIGNIMWGNDLPHPEGTYPYTRFWMRERFKDVSTDETRRMLGETAAEVYGVDRAALAPLVQRIGPTPDDVHGDTPLERVPVEV
ncbi:MAG TPA: amidohydrolase family protein [Acidimicrobiia bacterium]|nr:amidohydrolase family protein [Acidimicrobiia bacterium]